VAGDGGGGLGSRISPRLFILAGTSGCRGQDLLEASDESAFSRGKVIIREPGKDARLTQLANAEELDTVVCWRHVSGKARERLLRRACVP
jgi:hypothetical protein